MPFVLVDDEGTIQRTQLDKDVRAWSDHGVDAYGFELPPVQLDAHDEHDGRYEYDQVRKERMRVEFCAVQMIKICEWGGRERENR